jgi:exodeoxyribonuclease-3
MQITTWNVNSLRARLDRVLAWIDAYQPDVLCMQELKCQDAEVPVLPFVERGYTIETHGQKTYNGVAIASRLPMTEVRRAIPDADDSQARGISAVIGGVRIVNLYVPNGGSLDSDKYPYKLGWLDKLLVEMASYSRVVPAPGKLLGDRRIAEPFLICGDFNIAPADADVYDPKGWKDQVLVSEPERERFRKLLDLGLTDTWRHFSSAPNAYTWWDYRGNGFGLNQGLRIDHHLCSAELLARATDVTVDMEERGKPQASDHAPVTLHLRDRSVSGG